MQVFHLKHRDTLPILDVYLKKPDQTAFDLTGSTAWKLHIQLSNGTKLTRTMSKVGTDADGHVRYAWIATEWDAGSTPDSEGAYTVGGLDVGQHKMEYEVIGPGGARLTFPNNGYDRLSIVADVGQG
jgi:hypothetical protein